MSEIRDKVIKEGVKLLWKEKWKDLPFDCKGFDKQTEWEWDRERKHLRHLINQILSIPEIAIVDREAELPELNLPTIAGQESLTVNMKSFAKKIRTDMLEEGWIKEVKDAN